MKAEQLRQRTFEFGIRCVKLSEALPKGRAGDVIARQLLRCGTSVGSNYRAAIRARSRNEFVAKLGIVEEECDEAIYWLEIIAELKLVKPVQLSSLKHEANELLAITISSIKTARSRAKSTSFK